MADEAVAEIWTFPTEIAQFDKDDRISFSKLDGKYIAVQEDGAEFEFDQGLKRWIPHEDEDEHDADVAEFSASISTPYQSDRDLSIRPAAGGAAGAGAGGRAATDGARQGSGGKKRKQEDQAYGQEPSYEQDTRRGYYQNQNAAQDSAPASSNKRVKTPGQGPLAKPKQPKQNTAVYVTGLPSDATVDEVAELFSRKCGVIAEEIDSGRPRIKMYTDANGEFKGDALVVFFKPQSVDMAIMLLDDTDFRFSSSAAATKMHVQAADSSYKKTNYQEGEGAAAPAPAPTADGPAPPRPKKGGQDKQRIIKKTQKLDAKLADWSSEDEGPLASYGGGGSQSKRNPKWDKVVILKHMFTLQELDEDPSVLVEIKEDIRDECAKLGEVTNVVLFDKEEAGIVSVKFKAPESAKACLQLMHGRAFDGRTVEATLATGREKYNKSKKEGSDNDDDQDDE